jgi:hypothetical protein
VIVIRERDVRGLELFFPIVAQEVAKVLRGMRDTYSPWTQTAFHRILKGVFTFALRRGSLTRSPMDGLAPSERPKQRNAKAVKRLGESWRFNASPQHGGTWVASCRVIARWVRRR